MEVRRFSLVRGYQKKNHMQAPLNFVSCVELKLFKGELCRFGEDIFLRGERSSLTDFLMPKQTK